MFKHFNNIRDIIEPENNGYLYLFDVEYYDNNTDIKLPENTIKFGKTIANIKPRLLQYKYEKINIRNIEYIHCSYPEERERLLKVYIKEETNYRPVQGIEYFVINRELLKFLITVFVSISNEDIVLYEKYYSEKQIEYKQLFLRINNIIKEKELNPEFIITIEKQPEIKETILKQFKCKFCENILATKQSLLRHQETCKIRKTYLIEEEKKENNKKIEDEHLNQVEILTKQIETLSSNYEKQIETLTSNHDKQIKELIESNKISKQQTYILEQQNLMYKDELRIQREEFDKRILKLEYECKIDIKCKEEQLKAKDNYIKKLEDDCNDYKKISKEALRR